MTSLLLAVIYIAFISLGLPDTLLGAAWPCMFKEFGVAVSRAGLVSMTIAAGTVFSSLMSDRLTRALGAGRVMVFSVATTALALFGFSMSRSFWILILWAVPYGLGAGSVDAALNNYVALHYKSRHMSWLHCMWGVGTIVGPAVMGFALTGGARWNAGYRFISILQIGLTAILAASLPLWKKCEAKFEIDENKDGAQGETRNARSESVPLLKIFSIPGAKEILIAFFCYSAVEQTAMLWGSSYLTIREGVPPETAAFFAGMFSIGITVGRAISGFLTMRMSDAQMTRLGQAVVFAGVVLILLPFGKTSSIAGLVLVGLGCAPIYPCIIHSTPAHFGADKSQALIGMQMAFAYVGTTFMPPLFGFLASRLTMALFPFYLLAFLALMVAAHETLERKTNQRIPKATKLED